MVKSFHQGPQRTARWLLVAVVVLSLLVPASAVASPVSTPDAQETVIWKYLCPGTIMLIPENDVRHVVCYESALERPKAASVLWKEPCPGTVMVIPEGRAAHVVCSIAS